MRSAKFVLRLIAVVYLLQIASAVFFHFRPITQREFKDERHVLRRGRPLPESLVPALGAIQFLPDVLVTLTIYDASGRSKAERVYDFADAAFDEYPAVWPEHRKRANKAPEPTTTSVMPAAKAAVPPAAVVAHL